MLQVEGLTCRYGKVEAVRDLTIAVNQGELVTLIGANGAGKTTTLKAISGVLAPTAGRITFLGEDITRASARRILQLGIAHCPEGRRVFPYMTVAENLEMGCYLRSDSAGIAADLDKLYARFPILAERRHQAAGTLSGGEQQMLAISRALMSRPKLVLFDEPSLGLAPNLVERTFEIIKGDPLAGRDRGDGGAERLRRAGALRPLLRARAGPRRPSPAPAPSSCTTPTSRPRISGRRLLPSSPRRRGPTQGSARTPRTPIIDRGCPPARA